GFPSFSTSIYMIDEILNAFLSTKTVPHPPQLDQRKSRAKAAVKFVTGVCEILPSDDVVRRHALRIYYHGHADKEYGVADCVSFHLMDEHAIGFALAFDHHFTQAGKLVLSTAVLT
ncbi:MAG: hypothetical protein R6U70_01800, partial [Bacillota bacterium]